MILKKAIHREKEIRCFNMIMKSKDKKIGEKCNARLIDRNSLGHVAGRIKCLRCGALLEITNEYIYLIKTKEG